MGTRIWETQSIGNKRNPNAGYCPPVEPTFLETKIQSGFEPITTLESGVDWDPVFQGAKNSFAPGFDHMDDSGSSNHKDVSFNVEFARLSKESRVWGAQGQMKLSREALRRSKALLNGNVNEYRRTINSESLFIPTNRFNIRSNNAPGSSCFVICSLCKGYSGNHTMECSMNIGKH
jgi:hypothetical protein